MQAPTLAETKTAKTVEIRTAAELAFWDSFTGLGGDIPVMTFAYIVMKAMRDGTASLPQTARDQMIAASAVVDRMRSLVQQINAATTIEQVQAIHW